MMYINPYREQDKPCWDHYVLNHPSGTAYHLSAWKKAVEAAYGFEQYSLVARSHDPDSGPIIGVLPLIHHHLPFVNGRLVSLPFCDAAGPLANSTHIETALLEACQELLKYKGIKALTLRGGSPFAGYDPETTLNPEKVRMVLQLPGNSETLMAAFKAKVRSQVKKPIKDGLASQIGGMELLDDFYQVFEENMRDLGSPVHSFKMIRSVLKFYKNRAQIAVVKMPDGEVAAAGLILCHPKVVSIPWASSLRRYNRWNPNMLLYWTFLRFSSDMGYPAFDFGRSTPKEGTFRFKKQWGAVPKDLHWFNSDEPTARENGLNLRAAAERIIQFMPVQTMRALGPAVRKYITL